MASFKKIAVAVAVLLPLTAQAKISEDEVLFCAAVFELRAEQLHKWGGQSEAPSLWADKLAAMWSLRNLEVGGTCPGENSGPFNIMRYCRSIGPGYPSSRIEDIKQDLRTIYQSQHLMDVYPRTCMEDDACAVCMDLLQVL